MNIQDFTHKLLPNLINDYSQGGLELHALVDFDLWKRIFPDTSTIPAYAPVAPAFTSDYPFFWHQIRLNAFELKDSTLLLVYTLPTPLLKDQPKFCGIRIDRQTRQAHYYVLTKPQKVDDAWDILWMPFPKAAKRMKLEFQRKIDGTDSLRNFVLTVQQIAFDDTPYNTSFLSSLLGHLRDSLVPME